MMCSFVSLCGIENCVCVCVCVCVCACVCLWVCVGSRTGWCRSQRTLYIFLNVCVLECRCTRAVWQDTKKLWSIAMDNKYRVAKTHRMP